MKHARVVLSLLVLGVACAEQVEETDSSAKSDVPSDVVQLDDSNFEHLTQVSTGSTTGDWFVAFVAPWCGFCKELKPVWEELATELKGEMNVATVDITQNVYVRTRFDVHSFPTIALFRDGVMYLYDGDRSVEAFTGFARDDLSAGDEHDNVTAAKPVPKDDVFVTAQVLWDIVDETAKAYAREYTIWSVVGAGAALAFGAGVVFTLALLRCCGSAQASKAKRD